MTRDDSDAEDSAEATDESSQDDMVEGGQPSLTLLSSVLILRSRPATFRTVACVPGCLPHCPHPSGPAPVFTPTHEVDTVPGAVQLRVCTWSV